MHIFQFMPDIKKKKKKKGKSETLVYRFKTTNSKHNSDNCTLLESTVYHRKRIIKYLYDREEKLSVNMKLCWKMLFLNFQKKKKCNRTCHVVWKEGCTINMYSVVTLQDKKILLKSHHCTDSLRIFTCILLKKCQFLENSFMEWWDQNWCFGIGVR